MDREEMLAYIEYGAKQQLSVDEIYDGIIQHLRLTFGICITIDDVKDELHRSWRLVHGQNSKLTDLSRVCRRGFKDFVHAKDHAQISRIKAKTQGIQLRKLQDAFDTPRKLRASSAAAKSSHVDEKNLMTRSPSLRHTGRNASEISVSQSASRKQHLKRLQRSRLLRGIAADKGQNIKNEGSFDFEGSIAIDDGRLQVPAIHNPSRGAGKASESHYRIPETPSPSRGATIESPQSESACVVQNTPSLDASSTFKKTTLAGRAEESSSNVRRKNAEIRYWKRRCDSAEKTCKAVQDRINDLDQQLKVISTNAGLDAMQSLVDKLQIQLRELEGIRDLAEVRQRLDDKSLPVINPLVIGKIMDKIAAELQQLDAYESFSIGPDLDLEATTQAPELIKLLEKVCPEISSTALDVSRMRQLFELGSKVPQALVGAAICEWVFESSHRDLFEDNSQDAFYSGIRRPYDMLYDLVSLKDPLLARNGDFEVHRCILQDSTFATKCIRAKAEQLGLHMGKFLQILLSDAGQKSSRRRRSTISAPTLKLLSDIFELALHVRTQLMLSEDDFRIRKVVSNTTFDSKSMKCPDEAISNTLQGENDGTPFAVRLTILPGIHMHKRKSIRKRIDYDSPLETEEPHPNGGKCWVQALVVPKDPETD